MGEDRRPNIAGEPLNEPEGDAENTAEPEQRKLRAKSLRQRSGVDGHEDPAPPPEDEEPG